MSEVQSIFSEGEKGGDGNVPNFSISAPPPDNFEEVTNVVYPSGCDKHNKIGCDACVDFESDVDEQDAPINPQEGDEYVGSGKLIWYVELIQVLMLVLMIAYSVMVIILQGASPGSILMTINSIVAIVLTVVVAIAMFVRWIFLRKGGLPVGLKYLYVGLVILCFLAIHWSTVPLVVFRQATEDFWTLFMALPAWARALLITTSILFVVIFLIAILTLFIHRYDFIRYLFHIEKLRKERDLHYFNIRQNISKSKRGRPSSSRKIGIKMRGGKKKKRKQKRKGGKKKKKRNKKMKKRGNNGLIF